jgi:hypothetical protein
MEAYTEMIYGWCLMRIIHFIVALRLAYPNLPILIVKYDYSDAYRRVAQGGALGLRSSPVHHCMCRCSLHCAETDIWRIPEPPYLVCLSEMVTDLSNEIPLCKDWDHSKLRSPAQPKTPVPIMLPSDILIAKARPIAFHIPMTVTAITNSFIDDLIQIFFDTPLNCASEPHAIPLAIHVTSGPHMGKAKPVQRRGLLLAPKLKAEGTPAEVQCYIYGNRRD